MALKSILAAFGCVLTCASATAGSPKSDDFSGTALQPFWIPVSPNPDSSIALDGKGHLVLVASPLNGGSDLAPGPNNHAPMILQSLPATKDWQIQTAISVTETAHFQGAGIILATQPGNFTLPSQFWRVTELQYYTGVGLRVCMISGCFPYSGRKIYLRIQKTGTTIGGAYSQDGKQWIPIAPVQSPAWQYVGLDAERQAWDNDLSLYTTARFDYFKVTKP